MNKGSAYLKAMIKRYGKIVVIDEWYKKGKIKMTDKWVKSRCEELSCVDFLKEFELSRKDFQIKLVEEQKESSISELLLSNIISKEEFNNFIKEINKNRLSQKEFIRKLGIDISYETFKRWKMDYAKQYLEEVVLKDIRSNSIIDSIIEEDGLVEKIFDSGKISLQIGDEIEIFDDVSLDILIKDKIIDRNHLIQNVRYRIIDDVNEIQDLNKLESILAYVDKKLD